MTFIPGNITDFDIARGLVSGMSHVNKFGRNSDVDATEDIWDGGGLWVPPIAARTHDIASTDDDDAGTLVSTGTADTGSSTVLLFDAAADFVGDGVAAGDAVLNDTNIDHSIVMSVTDLNTLVLEPTHHANYTANQASSIGFNNGDTYRVVTPASTGASVVHIFGLDSNMAEAEEFIILDGNPAGAGSNVPTIRTYWRIFRMHLDGAASRIINNEGTITATAQVDGTVTAQINIGNGQTLMAIYTIPAGKTGYMTNFTATINRTAVGALANMSLRQTKFAALDGSGSIVEHFFSLATDGSSSIYHPFKPEKVFQERTDIWIRCESVTATNTDITGSFDIKLVAV